jgi:hypothetical protein
MTGRQLALGVGEDAVDELEVVDATVLGEGESGSVASIAAAALRDALTEPIFPNGRTSDSVAVDRIQPIQLTPALT